MANILFDDINSYVSKLIEQELGSHIKAVNRAGNCRKTDDSRENNRKNRLDVSGETRDEPDE